MNNQYKRGLSIIIMTLVTVFIMGCDAIEQAKGYKETYDELDSLGLGIEQLKEIDLDEVDSLSNKLQDIIETTDFEDEEVLKGLDSIKKAYGLDSIDNKDLLNSAQKMMEKSDSVLDFLKKMQGQSTEK